MADKADTTGGSSPPADDKLQQLHDESVKKRSDATTDDANGVKKLESDTVAEGTSDETAVKKEEVAEGKAKTDDSSRPKKRGSRFSITKTNEFEDLEETDDPEEIRAQVEFYFSNENLRTDEHLFYEIQGTKNLPVGIKHIHTFKRMRRFQPYRAVVNALRGSEQLQVFDTDEYAGAGREAVARKEIIDVPVMTRKNGEPIDNDNLTVHEEFNRMRLHNKNALAASIYVNNFGPADKVGQIAIERFFKPYGAVMVRRRLHDDGSWKGSVFVEFKDPAAANDFLELDPRPTFDGNVLQVESKKGYSERKCAEKGIKPHWEQAGGRDHERRDRGSRNYHYRGGRGRGRGNRDRDSRPRRHRSRSRDSNDSRDWNGRRDKFQKSKDFKGGKDYKGGRRNERAPSHDKEGNRLNEHGHPVDERGVPKIGDSSKLKRKANEEPESAAPKKSKIEILEDE